MKIKKITAREILDSRGNPTVAATVMLDDESIGHAAVPSGASTGKHEAVELRDNDTSRYGGLGVLHAVENVKTTIATALQGMEAQDQRKVDETMITLDGTENKSKLGANAILSVSMAVSRAQAASEKKELFEYLTKFNPDFTGTYIMPVPQMNVLNGGKHGNWSTDIQEYMILPVGATTETDAIRFCAEVYAHLKKVLKEKKYSISVGDEGGFAPNFLSNEEPFQVLSEAITRAGYHLRKDFVLGIDSAASEFFENGKYKLNKEGKVVTNQELSDFYAKVASEYPIVSMEDIFAEDDWDGFRSFTLKHGKTIQVVGDDLYVTNVKRLKRGIQEHTTNSILIKLNQIGTLSETVDAILLARKNGFTSIISHRSGETEDPFIADLSVAMGTGQIKTGAPARGERVVKYNRLMQIEEIVKEKSEYPGAKFF